MIRLTRLNSHPFALNSDLIKFVEQAPDTVISLTTGEKVVVRESAEEVIQRVIEFRRAVLQDAARIEGVTACLPSALETKQDEKA